MAIIVASLFLPYQPQFAVNASEGEAAELVDSQLVKINTPIENARVKRSSSVHASSPFQPIDAVTQEGAAGQSDGGKSSADRDIVSAEFFMENLTANATTAVTPTASHLSKNTSMDDFFLTPSAQFPEQADSPAMSVLSSPDLEIQHHMLSVHDNISTSSLLKNVSKSLLYQSVRNSSGSQTSLEGHSMYHTNSPHSTVITPKSKAVPGHNNAVVNFAKMRQQQNQHNSLPSMKRIAGNKQGTTSNLKYSQSAYDSSSISREDVISESDEEVRDGDDFDLESTSNEKYNVPRFGGYSNNAKLRASLLRSSRELFSQVPWKIVPGLKGNGALKNAVETAAFEKTITEPVTWVGTVGIPTDEIPADIVGKITNSLEKDFNSAAVITDDITFKGAYKNFCKQILWPTLHYQIPDNPNSKAFEGHSWSYYCRLNQQFADKIVETYTVGDTIWIHDYHLMLVPEMVRGALPDAKIGFFLHVSFPSSEVFRCFAHRERILRGIIGASFVGFQTKEYARHFLQTSNRLLMADTSEDGLKYKGKIISVKDTPIGIDVFNINQQVKNEKTLQWRELIRDRWKGKKLIVGRDQFDRIRGLDKKLLAFERFLRDNPEYIDKVVLVQICLGTSKDPELERQVMLIVDRINAMASNISLLQPVVFLHQDLDFEQYLAINQEADLFLVSAFREGMNLTCHEFIACSETKNSPLLLSEFTGSADVLKDGALLINPWDIIDAAQKIKQALEMSFEEKRRLWKTLMKSIIIKDSDNWIISSLQAINNSWEFNQEISRVFYVSSDEVYSDYNASRKHMFIFKLSEPPTPRMITILNELTANNIVFILANFSKVTLESLYSRVLNVGLIAENGAYVRLDGTWYTIVESVDWKHEVVKILDDKAERLPGSYYKVADSMIRFHTENAEDKERISGVVGEAITHINTLFSDSGIHAYIHKDIVFVQQTGLALAATQFILKFFNSSVMRNDSSTLASTPVTQLNRKNIGGDYFSNGSGQSQNHVDFICITGSSSPVIEPLFQLVKNELAKKRLSYGHSIVYGNATSTYAKAHIDGSSELFTILEHITKLINQ